MKTNCARLESHDPESVELLPLPALVHVACRPVSVVTEPTRFVPVALAVAGRGTLVMKVTVRVLFAEGHGKLWIKDEWVMMGWKMSRGAAWPAVASTADGTVTMS